MNAPLNLEQLRKQAKELARARREAGRPTKLADAQLVLAREHGFPTWPRLKEYVERLDAEQPFHTDIEYYEGRAYGISTVNGVSMAEARRDLAQRHGFPTWNRLRRHVGALRDGTEPPTPFVLAYRAVEADDGVELTRQIDAHLELVAARGTNGNDLLGMATRSRSSASCSTAARTRTAGTTMAGRSSTRPATRTGPSSHGRCLRPAAAAISPLAVTAGPR